MNPGNSLLLVTLLSQFVFIGLPLILAFLFISIYRPKLRLFFLGLLVSLLTAFKFLLLKPGVLPASPWFEPSLLVFIVVELLVLAALYRESRELSVPDLMAFGIGYVFLKTLAIGFMFFLRFIMLLPEVAKLSTDNLQYNQVLNMLATYRLTSLVQSLHCLTYGLIILCFIAYLPRVMSLFIPYLLLYSVALLSYLLVADRVSSLFFLQATPMPYYGFITFRFLLCFALLLLIIRQLRAKTTHPE